MYWTCKWGLSQVTNNIFAEKDKRYSLLVGTVMSNL